MTPDTRRPADAIPPGIKLEGQVQPDAPDEQFRFVRQMGLTYVSSSVPGKERERFERGGSGSAAPDYEYLVRVRERFDRHGLSIYNWGDWRSESVILGLPNRDEVIESYNTFLWALGRVGIPCSTYAHWPVIPELFRTEPEVTRGGARAAAFDVEEAPAVRALRYGREYSEQEIWDNFAYFITRVAPVAEAAGVLIALHPEDPPLPVVAGVPRCIFRTFEGYQRAFEIADSPNVGVCLCTGCWLEGGDSMGESVVQAALAFGAAGKLFHVHFRNVSAPLPHFVETFVDDGYFDMYQVMKALRTVDYRGGVSPDHIPLMADDRRVGQAFTLGYMKALAQRADDEVGPASPPALAEARRS
jgi:mannonate dehydratase